MEFQTKLIEIMEKNGIHIDGEVNWASGEIQRFRVKNHWKRGRPIFLMLHSGGASFGDWREPSTWRTWWEKSWRDISIQEQQARRDAAIRLNHERELLRNHAIFRAQEFLNHKTHLGWTCIYARDSHTYVKAKRIRPYYALQCRSYLILPIHDVDNNLISLQYITAKGWKQFKKNASPKGGMMHLYQKIQKDNIIRICEGYATGCSIYEAIGRPVIIAFSASNLLEVAVSVRNKYPHNDIHICGDNDQWNKENVGVDMAKAAARACGGKIVYPEFKQEHSDKKPTDFNDLMCLEGIEEVERQLLSCKSYN